MAGSGDRFLYFLIGGFVGASVALLFAPRTGEETRQFLEGKYRSSAEGFGRRVRTGRERVVGAKEEIRQKVTDSIERGKETVTRQKEQITSAIEAGKKAYQDEKDKIAEPGDAV